MTGGRQAQAETSGRQVSRHGGRYGMNGRTDAVERTASIDTMAQVRWACTRRGTNESKPVNSVPHQWRE